MNNLEMLIGTAYDRIKGSCQKSGSYVWGKNMPMYIHYALKEKDMDVLSVTFTVPEWILRLDITWTGNAEIYSLDINEEEADSLSPRNIQAVVPGVNIRILENALLWWLTETTFPEQDEDEYI